jgi:exonuclease VII small subunit
MEDPDDSEFRTLMQKLNAVEQKVDEVVEFNNSHDDD